MNDTEKTEWIADALPLIARMATDYPDRKMGEIAKRLYRQANPAAVLMEREEVPA